MAAKTKSTKKPKPKKTTAKKQQSGTSRGAARAAARSEKPVAVKKPVKRMSGEVQGILLITAALLLVCAFFVPAAGIVGEFIKNVCYGLFGAASSVFFVYFILAGINSFRLKENESAAYKWVVLLGLMICSGVIFALVKHDTSFTDGGFISNLRALYENGVDGIGGGIISGFICKVLTLLIGYMGAWVCACALTLVLFIILTGISVEKIFRGIGGFFARIRESFRRRMEREIEFDPEDPPHTTEKAEKRPSTLKLMRDRRAAKKKAKRLKREARNKKADQTLPKAKPRSEKPNIPETPTKPQRFVIREDEDQSGDLADSERPKFRLEDLPFDIDGIKSGTIEPETDDDGPFDDIDVPAFLDKSETGALTDIPPKDGSAKPKPESDGGDDFEPPSDAAMEDKLDPLTKAALDSGAPLDEAVTRGRKMALESGEPQKDASEADKIAAEIGKTEALNTPVYYHYSLPPIDLLAEPRHRRKTNDEIKRELEEKANRLLDTLNSFKVEAQIINITQGPSVTRFELQPGKGVKVSKITGLSDDIALSLAASGVRIEAPIPGKSAIGIEIPNTERQSVPIREVIDTPEFKNKKSKTAVALGKDISGSCVVADIADFPHILIAGATGSGKSVCINSLITSILYKAKPNEIKMIMVDPKMVELGVYNGIPHLLIPVVTDPKHAAGALNWAVIEMQNRYALLKDNKVRNLDGYNKLMEENGEPDAKLPEIVIIIDELADLMSVAKSEVEEAINRLAALARAAGMYLVIATQRPSVNVITGVIKANIPSRIAFAVSQQVDSRTIIDSAGAEKLLGMGDMLYYPRGELKPIRVQGNYVSDNEIEALVNYIKDQYEAEYDEELIEEIEKEHEKVAADLENASPRETPGSESGPLSKTDDMFLEAVELVLENGQASVAMFQRKFKMGYQRAAKLIDQMEERKIIGPYEGTKPRQVLITRQELNEMKFNRDNA